MKPETLAAIATLSGTFLGWFLSALQHWVESGRNMRRTRANTRLLIAHETKANAEALHAFWEHIESRKDEWQKVDGNISTTRLGKVIVDTPFPDLCTFVWFSNAALLGQTYSKTEIDNLWQTYADYSGAANLYQHIVRSDTAALESSKHLDQKFGRVGAMPGGRVFYQKAAEHVEKFMTTIERLLNKSSK